MFTSPKGLWRQCVISPHALVPAPTAKCFEAYFHCVYLREISLTQTHKSQLKISFEKQQEIAEVRGVCLAANLVPKPPTETHKGKNNQKKVINNSALAIFSHPSLSNSTIATFFLL